MKKLLVYLVPKVIKYALSVFLSNTIKIAISLLTSVPSFTLSVEYGFFVYLECHRDFEFLRYVKNTGLKKSL